MEYEITESDKYQVESINIEGNTKTKSTVILRELVLAPGDVFDSVRMKISKLRLENTRFFEDPVNVTDESTKQHPRPPHPQGVGQGGARTGNLTFGAGFSSLEKAVLFAEVSQSNFDLFNRRSFFQGDGQKFRLRFQIGSQSSEVLLNFEEPYFLERQLAVGFSLYRTTSDYNSSYYEEIRTGGQVYMRKRLFNWLDSQLSYTYESVDIANVASNAPISILLQQGKTTTSKIGVIFTQDTRDKIINTTRGYYASLGLNVAGGPLGGDNSYYNIEWRSSKFFPLAEFQEQVLSIIGRAGVTDSYGDSNKVQVKTITLTDPRRPGVPAVVPVHHRACRFYDRFFLGGPHDPLRGFDYRDVGPKDLSGEPVGGNTYAFLSLEYSADVVPSPCASATSSTTRASSNSKAYDFSSAQLQRQLRLRPPPGSRAARRSALTWALPLTTDRYNHEGEPVQLLVRHPLLTLPFYTPPL